MQRIRNILVSLALVASAPACSKPASAPETGAAPAPKTPGRFERLTLVPTGRLDFTVAIAPPDPTARRVEVPARQDVTVTVAQIDGALGPVSIRLIESGEAPARGTHTLRGPVILYDDAMTCAAPGCALKATLRAGRELLPEDEAHVLVVRLQGAAPETLRVTLEASPPGAE